MYIYMQIQPKATLLKAALFKPHFYMVLGTPPGIHLMPSEHLKKSLFYILHANTLRTLQGLNHLFYQSKLYCNLVKIHYVSLNETIR